MDTLFGTGTDLNAIQMSARAIAIFVIALAMLRTAGRRSLGLHNAFDSCTTVLLGAILSRAVVGASPFWPTVAASLALVLMHRFVALACIRWPWFEKLVSGEKRELLQDGHVDPVAMRKALLTHDDLVQEVRKKIGSESIAKIKRAVLERDGQITVVPKPDQASGAPPKA